jgi:hypothetical protein
MGETATTELLRKLVAVGAVLGSVSLAFDIGSSTFAPHPQVFWTVSDASTFQSPQAPSGAELDLAMAEVRAARAILSSREVRGETAYDAYLAALDTALRAYEASATTPRREVRLATALAVARTALSDDVTRLSSWLAVVRSTGRDEQFVTVPARFVARESVALEHDEALADADVASWLDLDSAGV